MINYVPKYFGVMPKENGDEITLDEVRSCSKCVSVVFLFAKWSI